MPEGSENRQIALINLRNIRSVLARHAQQLLARLRALHKKCRLDEPWRIEKEPHNYPDGTTHFNHVRQTARVNGEPLAIRIASHVTPELAELLVLMRNNLPELIRLARLGLGYNADLRDRDVNPINQVRVQTDAYKNVVVRVEYEDGVIRVLFAGRPSVLPLDPTAADPADARIEVANQLKRLGTDLLNVELDRINIVRPAAEEPADSD